MIKLLLRFFVTQPVMDHERAKIFKNSEDSRENREVLQVLPNTQQFIFLQHQ